MFGRFVPAVTTSDGSAGAFSHDARKNAWQIIFPSAKADPVTGILNNANLWASETMGTPKYPQELLLRVINLSLETKKIMDGLPKLDI